MTDKVGRLNSGPPRCLGPNLELMGVTSYGKGFVHVVMLRVLRWGEYTGLPGWALHAITNVLVRRRQRESTDRRKGKMTTKAERGATHPQAKEFQPPELGEAGNSFSSEPAEGAQPCPHCDFGPVELISDFRPPELLREEICVVF